MSFFLNLPKLRAGLTSDPVYACVLTPKLRCSDEQQELASMASQNNLQVTTLIYTCRQLFFHCVLL